MIAAICTRILARATRKERFGLRAGIEPLFVNPRGPKATK